MFKHNLIQKFRPIGAVLGFLTVVTFCGLNTKPAQAQTAVDRKLTLGLDVSGSVDASEFELQKQGYIDAFNNIDFTGQDLVVSFYYWSSDPQDPPAIPSFRITDNNSAQQFADLIEATSRPNNIGDGTEINEAIDFGVDLLTDNSEFTSDNLILDLSLSGDGVDEEDENFRDEDNGTINLPIPSGNNPSLETSVNNAEIEGVIVNGLAIGQDFDNLDEYYIQNVITTDGFGVGAQTLDDFGDAIEGKLRREIEPSVPEPSSILGLLAIGGLGLAKLKKQS